MQREATMPAPNPIARLAGSVPFAPALGASVVARLAGIAAAFAYAAAQDRLFPEDSFPRQWTYVAVVSVLVLLSLVAVPGRTVSGRIGSFLPLLGALGCGLLVAAGANLAKEPWGVVTLAAGVVAWAGYAVAAHQKGTPPGTLLTGLFAGMGLSFLLVGAIVLTIQH